MTRSAPLDRPSPRTDSVLLAGLTVGVGLLGYAMLRRGLTTGLEAASFLSGALCVWLTVRESVWNFPVGMVNVATFFVVFYRAGLLADTGLQVVYFVLGAIGWYLWLYGGANRTPLSVTSVPHRRRVVVGLTTIVVWGGLYVLLRCLGGASPFWDAFTTAVCLSAQWLTDRKCWESWLLWMLADVIYVPLYASKSLFLTATLYGVFLVMCSIGLRQWLRAADRRAGAA